MIVLLLTGTIDLGMYEIPNTKITSKIDRLSQYLYSIEYAIEHYSKISHIVFCENSNYNHDYSKLIQYANSKNKILEVLIYNGDFNKIVKLGKGFGEGEIIKYALKNSSYLKYCDGFYKLTGRLVVKNMNLVMKMNKNNNAFVFYPNSIYHKFGDYINTVFYRVDMKLYLDELIYIYEDVNDLNCIFLEHLFYLKLKQLKIKSFLIFPIISGQSASTGINYDLQLSKYLVEVIFSMIGVHNTYQKGFLKYLVIFLGRIRNSIMSN